MKLTTLATICLTMTLTVCLTACNHRQEVDASSDIDLSDCKIAVVRIDDPNGLAHNVTVIRCPNSTVSTSNTHEKTRMESTTIDGDTKPMRPL